jgi:micrococcal nuclease
MAVPDVFERHATVTRVVDGDTLHLSVDLGCDTTLAMTVRLYGVNAPEMNTDAGKAAKAFVEQWVAESPAPVFVLRTVKDKKEKYGRYLADLVRVVVGGESLCEALLSSGHAVPYMI